MDQASSTLDRKMGNKGKVVPVHAMKVYRGSCSITPFIFNLGSSSS
jgi:hypothetical protein